MEEPFSLKTLSYWSLLMSKRSFYPSRFPPLVRDTILGDIDFLKKLQGRYLMVHSTGTRYDGPDSVFHYLWQWN